MYPPTQLIARDRRLSQRGPGERGPGRASGRLSGPLRLGRLVATRGAGPALGATYLSLLVLGPIAAILSKAFSGGPSTLWQEISQPETVAALRLTVLSSLAVVAVNMVAGLVIAWLLVRDRSFFPNRLIGAVVDLPFALPTVIAGVTLVAVYGSSSPLHLDIAYTRWAVMVALAFVTLPFSVRSVQPVLAALDGEPEEAAASLGARQYTTFRRITLPSLAPALLTGAGLGFARAIGEYGSVVIFTGGIPFKTEVASVRIFGLYESDSLPAAAAVSLVLFLMAAAMLLIIRFARNHYLTREAS